MVQNCRNGRSWKVMTAVDWEVMNAHSPGGREGKGRVRRYWWGLECAVIGVEQWMWRVMGLKRSQIRETGR
jgi:hypothetical protein